MDRTLAAQDPNLTPLGARALCLDQYPELLANPSYVLLCLEDPSLGPDCQSAWYRAQSQEILGTITRALKDGWASHDSSIIKQRRDRLTLWLYWYWHSLRPKFDLPMQRKSRRLIRRAFAKNKLPDLLQLREWADDVNPNWRDPKKESQWTDILFLRIISRFGMSSPDSVSHLVEAYFPFEQSHIYGKVLPSPTYLMEVYNRLFVQKAMLDRLMEGVP